MSWKTGLLGETCWRLCQAQHPMGEGSATIAVRGCLRSQLCGAIASASVRTPLRRRFSQLSKQTVPDPAHHVMGRNARQWCKGSIHKRCTRGIAATITRLVTTDTTPIVHEASTDEEVPSGTEHCNHLPTRGDQGGHLRATHSDVPISILVHAASTRVEKEEPRKTESHNYFTNSASGERKFESDTQRCSYRQSPAHCNQARHQPQ